MTSAARLSFPVASLLDQASSRPDRVVFVADGDRWTSSRLAAESARLAAGLQARGVRPGDRVAVHMHSTVHAALSYLACLRSGAIAVPLNTRYTTSELSDLVVRTQPLVYLGQSSLYDRFAAVAQQHLPDEARFLAPPRGVALDGTVGSWEDVMGDGKDVVDVPVDQEAPALLLSTSGTTGRSKLPVWSHRTLGALRLSAAGRGIVDGAVFPLMTPVMHGAGVYHLLNALTEGATAVLVPQFDAGTVLDAVQDHGCTHLFGLPFMYAELLREQRERPRRTSSLRAACVAGDTCPADVEAQFAEVFGVPLTSFWAATEEVGAMTAADVVGPFMRVIPEARVRVVDAAGSPVPDGEVGELVVSSPTTIPGYWEGEGRITPLAGGSFFSGDLVRRRSATVLEYVGRAKDLIVRGGSNIAPAEVEEALRGHPDVLDAAVTGVPDATLGQRVGALIVLSPAATRTVQEIMHQVAANLAGYKLPERVRTVTALPRNTLEKVDRAAVQAVLEQDGEPTARRT